MGTLVDNSAIRTIVLELLSKDKELMKDVLRVVLKENPQIIEDLSSEQSVEEDPNFPVLEGLTPERRKWLEVNINKHFEKYDDVFKALA